MKHNAGFLAGYMTAMAVVQPGLSDEDKDVLKQAAKLLIAQRDVLEER